MLFRKKLNKEYCLSNTNRPDHPLQCVLCTHSSEQCVYSIKTRINLAASIAYCRGGGSGCVLMTYLLTICLDEYAINQRSHCQFLFHLLGSIVCLDLSLYVTLSQHRTASERRKWHIHY